MKIWSFIVTLYFLLSMPFSGYAQKPTEIEVTVTKLSPEKGNLLIAIYNSEESFMDKYYDEKSVKVLNSKELKVTIALKSGDYAIAVFQDENENLKLDTNFMGIPTEGYGFSNNASGFMGPPSWDDAKFTIPVTKKMTIELK